MAWGILLLKFWLTGKIALLLHPDYMWLANTAAVFLLFLGAVMMKQLILPQRQTPDQALAASTAASGGLTHFTIFPRNFGSALLLFVAIVGLQFTPRPFASDVALNRGVTETLSMTRSQPQAFRASVRPEDRTLIEWVRTLNVYPEPDAYAGQSVNIDGFVIHPPNLPDSYLMLSRFVITCCAADVYPVGLPVKLTESQSAYPVDQWFRVEGSMITETLDGKRQLVIQANTLTAIEEPDNPYNY